MDRPEKPMEPEAGYLVFLDDATISCTDPRGRTSMIALADLERVVIRTTDEGPFSPDVFWVLSGADRTCIVPQGATGEDALVDKLTALPGFDFDAMIEAMSSSENREFECWRR